MGANFPIGKLFRGNCRGRKNARRSGGNSIGVNCQGSCCSGGNYSGVSVQGAKVRSAIVLGGSSWGTVIQVGMSRYRLCSC